MTNDYRLSTNTMYIDFNQIADNARLWVYQANRPLTPEEVTRVEQALQSALNGWAAHGHPLLSSARVVKNRFVLVAVDENHALPSGCSIDASVHFLQAIGKQLGVDFFDRSVAYIAANGSVQTLTLPQLKAAVAEGVLTPETTVFNNLIAQKADLPGWKVKAGDTWLKRYFKNILAGTDSSDRPAG
ncbi:hypothetical protein GCM10023187_23540 [Nibrella viscosa]|uniref:ABC transporter ATPase n=1 Tax=Nibrella viscosa TaxID=1084524 RepID=A0ABP8KG28_9BACT